MNKDARICKIVISILIAIIVILSLIAILSIDHETLEDYEVSGWETFIQKDQYESWMMYGTYSDWYTSDSVPQEAGILYLWEAGHRVDLFIVDNQNYQNFISNDSFFAVYYENGTSGYIGITLNSGEIIHQGPYYVIIDNTEYGYEKPCVNQTWDGSIHFRILIGSLSLRNIDSGIL